MQISHEPLRLLQQTACIFHSEAFIIFLCGRLLPSQIYHQLNVESPSLLFYSADYLITSINFIFIQISAQYYEREARLLCDKSCKQQVWLQAIHLSAYSMSVKDRKVQISNLLDAECGSAQVNRPFYSPL